MMMIFLKMRIIRVLEIPTFCLFFYTPPKKKTKQNKNKNKQTCKQRGMGETWKSI
jgi:hypothetical protein